jgi:hypothetical protein
MDLDTQNFVFLIKGRYGKQYSIIPKRFNGIEMGKTKKQNIKLCLGVNALDKDRELEVADSVDLILENQILQDEIKKKDHIIDDLLRNIQVLEGEKDSLDL